MVETMCRACLLTEENETEFKNMSIRFSEADLTIGTIYSRMSSVLHSADDGLPQKICQKCFQELSASYEFQKKCIQSDSEIRNILALKSYNVKIEASEMEMETEIEQFNVYSEDEKSESRIRDLLEEHDSSQEAVIERPNMKNKRKSRFKCEICNKVFDRAYGFNRHKKSHKPGEIFNYECKICMCKFTTDKNLKKHIDEKHLNRNEGCYPCPNCPRKFVKKASRSAHMQSHKGESRTKANENASISPIEASKLEVEGPHESSISVVIEKENVDNLVEDSSAEFENKTILEVNKENSNDCEPDSDEVEFPNPKNNRKAIHTCEICGKTFDRKYRLQRHLNIHNPEGRPFECDVCKWRFASEQNLMRHVIIHTAVADCVKQRDETPRIYRCFFCPRKFAKKESRASHMRVHKSNAPHTDVQEKNFKCQFCPKTFFKITYLTRHLYTHDNEKDFKCNVCDKGFSLRGDLVDHMNMHKGIKPFHCKICDKSFNQACTLKDHMRTHSGEKPFLCSECGKGFNNSSNLRQHTLRHSGQKPYKCSECPSSFTSKGGLKSHMSTHTKLKPHVCDTCGSTFTKRYSLKKHKRIHTGEKPYECTTCHMRFTSSNHLKRHIRTHTGEKPYSCKYCTRAFAQSNDLVKHLKSHLGDKIYKCDRCTESFRLHAELRDHQYQHYREEKEIQDQIAIQCEDIKCHLEQGGAPINYEVILDKKIVLKTDSCEISFSTPENLKLDIDTEHNKIDE